MKILKTLFFILFLTWSKFGFAQFPINEKDKVVKYEEVVKLSDMSKEEIYNKAKMWIVSTLKSGDNMIELSGSNSDKIVAAGNILVDSVQRGRTNISPAIVSNSYLNFKFIVYVKDGRLKYSIENFLLVMPLEGKTSLTQMGDNLYSSPRQLRKFKENNTLYLDRNVRAVTNSFKKYMVTEIEDDW